MWRKFHRTKNFAFIINSSTFPHRKAANEQACRFVRFGKGQSQCELNVYDAAESVRDRELITLPSTSTSFFV